MALEGNIFRLNNLAGLSESYRVYRVRGLDRTQPEFFSNRDALVRHLLYRLRAPCLAFEAEGRLEIVVRADATEPEPEIPLVGGAVVLEKTGAQRPVDFLSPDPRMRAIALRFINFMINRPLYDDKSLWQPASGGAFFEKQARSAGGLDLFRGFLVRAVSLNDGGIGLCVDGRLKFVSTDPLPVRLTRQEFRRYLGAHFLYRFGRAWLDIRPELVVDVPAERYVFLRDDQKVSLATAVAEAYQPMGGLQLPAGCAVVKYRNNLGEERAAPSVLCHLVHDTGSDFVRRIFHRAIPPPGERRQDIIDFVGKRLMQLKLGSLVLNVDPKPALLPEVRVKVPDFVFGRNQVLSVTGTATATRTTLDSLGARREELLLSPQAGLFDARPFGRQYLVLPRSIQANFGPAYVADLTTAVTRVHPAGAYAPVVVYYNDQVPGNFASRGAEIVDAVLQSGHGPGHALVMVHREQRARGMEEKLAAYIVRNLQQKDILAAVNHAVAAQKSYVRHPRGLQGWAVHPDGATRFRSYLTNVVLSKILITNGRWPYVLGQPLHADLVIGIDVKEYTAGFVAVAGGGREVASRCARSSQQERLARPHVKRLFLDVVRSCLRPELLFKRVVVHRDGRIFQSELDGLQDAVREMQAAGELAADVELTVVEVAKHSQAPVRFFENGNGRVENPTVGACFLAEGGTGYVATTGRPFRHPGTSNPLCVRVAHGPMPLRDCLEDVFALSCLAWSQPKDCSRYPITLKLADRFLAEIGAEYDENEPQNEPGNEMEAVTP